MTTLEYLSPAWLAALGDAIAASLPAALDTTFALGQVVTAAPPVAGGNDEGGGVRHAAHDVRYTLLLGPGTDVRVLVGSTDDADVVLHTGFAEARALARGDTSAASLLEQGRVKISGDARRLIEASDVLEVVGGALSELRDRTSF